MLDEFPDIIMSGLWVSNECFTFINAKGNIVYLIGGRMMKLGNAEKKQFILGYEGKQNRLYLIDKSLKVVAHRLMLSVLNYQAAILGGDDSKAESLISQVPESYYGKLAKFLEANGKKELAFKMTPDADHKFDLALALNLV